MASTFTLGIFSVPVERSATIPHALDDVWQISMGVIHFASAPIAITASLFLDSFHSLSKTMRVRSLCLASTVGFSFLMMASFAVSMQSASLIVFSVGMYAFPLAISKLDLNPDSFFRFLIQRCRIRHRKIHSLTILSRLE